MAYRYTYDPGSKKHLCPNCGEKRFVLTLDTETGEFLPDHVGKCDRANGCGYVFHWSQYIKENPDQKPEGNIYRKPEPPKLPRYIPDEFVESTLQPDPGNTFIKYLVKLFGTEIAKELARLYQVGTYNGKWPGAAVFWITDYHFRTRSGQMVHIDDTGHTVKYQDKEGNLVRRTRWVHTHLEYQPNRPAWLTDYLENPECWPCLFGEHLLQDNPEMPVAIVEAPKTAIIAAAYFPQYVWLAVGSMGNFSINRPDRLAALKGRSVVLFPDLKAYDDWSRKAAALSYITPFIISDFLEKNSTDAEREKGLDLADYLTRFPLSAFHKNAINSAGKSKAAA